MHPTGLNSVNVLFMNTLVIFTKLKDIQQLTPSPKHLKLLGLKGKTLHFKQEKKYRKEKIIYIPHTL